MGPEFDPIAGAQGWQISNPPMLSTAPLLASLEIFQRAGIARLREKSMALTGFLQRLIDERAARCRCRSSRRARPQAARLSVEPAPRAVARRRQALPRSADGGRRDRRLAGARRAAARPGPALQLVQRRACGGRMRWRRRCAGERSPGRRAHHRRGSHRCAARHTVAAPRPPGGTLREPRRTRGGLPPGAGRSINLALADRGIHALQAGGRVRGHRKGAACRCAGGSFTIRTAAPRSSPTVSGPTK